MGNVGGVLSIGCAVHVGGVGMERDARFWSAACVLAALLWLTVPVGDAGVSVWSAPARAVPAS